MRLLRAAGALGVTVAALTGCAHAARPTGLARPASTASPSATMSAAQPRCPLTGTVASAAAAARPALAVKIDNVAPARPQAGLNSADIVVEEQVEGGLTRLFAVFACHTATSIGPIRSARTTDADLLALLHGSIYVFSGANPKVLPPIRARGDAAMLSFDIAPRWFHRAGGRPAPHNVFSSSSTLLRGGLALAPRLGAPRAWFTYGAADVHGTPARSVTMSWPAATAGWTWSGSSYLRTQDRTSDLLTGGDRVSAANVVVLAVTLTATGIRDVAGNPSPDDVVVGSGQAWVFRGGTVVRGRWSRATSSAPWKLTDASGQVIALAPGRTWVELEAQPNTLRIS